jgi:outer membrane protein TolC
VAKEAIGLARAGLLPTVTAGAGTDTFKSTGSPRWPQETVGVSANLR